MYKCRTENFSQERAILGKPEPVYYQVPCLRKPLDEHTAKPPLPVLPMNDFTAVLKRSSRWFFASVSNKLFDDLAIPTIRKFAALQRHRGRRLSCGEWPAEPDDNAVAPQSAVGLQIWNDQSFVAVFL